MQTLLVGQRKRDAGERVEQNREAEVRTLGVIADTKEIHEMTWIALHNGLACSLQLITLGVQGGEGFGLVIPKLPQTKGSEGTKPTTLHPSFPKKTNFMGSLVLNSSDTT